MKVYPRRTDLCRILAIGSGLLLWHPSLTIYELCTSEGRADPKRTCKRLFNCFTRIGDTYKYFISSELGAFYFGYTC